ncbi:MAG: imm11 family protein [Anaerolineaceae bacterium]
MKFWKYQTDSDHYFTLVLADFEREKWVLSRDFQPGPIPEPIPPIHVRYVTESKDLSPSQRALLRKGKLPKADFPSLFGAHIVFNKKALDALWSLIQNDVQVIPLFCEEEQLFLIHLTRHVDGLDLEHSDVRWLVENEAVSGVNHYVFHEEKLKDVNIFRMPAHFTWTFFSDAFKEAVEEHDLKGLLWKPLP